MTEHVTAAARPWTLSTEAPFALRNDGCARLPRRRPGVQLGLLVAEGDRGLVRTRAPCRLERRALAGELGAQRAGRGHLRLRARRRHAGRGPFDTGFAWCCCGSARSRTRRRPTPPTWVRSDPERFPRVDRRTEGHAGVQLRGSDRRSRCSRSSAPSCARPMREPSRPSSATSWMPTPTAPSPWCRSRTSRVCSRDSRDRNELAEAAWNVPVPTELDHARARDGLRRHVRPTALGIRRQPAKAAHGRRCSATPPQPRRSSWPGLSRPTSSTSPLAAGRSPTS